jgi:predicted CXXCH cytochrome family protein
MPMFKSVLTCLFAVLLLTGSGIWAQAANPREIPRDCVDCHDDEGKALAARGAAHQEVGCRGCHVGHPLEGRKPYTDCVECHDPAASEHYTLPDCASCHDPHKPLDVDFSHLKSANEVCASCHADPIPPKTGPNPHAEMGCNECHVIHSQMPQCLGCHEPHSKEMGQKDCLGCHPAHDPKSTKMDLSQPAEACAGCHGAIVGAIKKNGGAHRDMGNCSECHKYHPPETGKAPVCADCHAPRKNAHFAVKNCAGCHDPHAPLVKPLAEMKNTREACVSCHPGPGEQMQKTPSAHSQQECVACHPRHGEAMACLDCHKPHKATMGNQECAGCHAPHAPQAAAISTNVPASSCAVCHEEVVTTFETSGAMHKESLGGCNDCHPRHGEAKSCMECHEPHSPSMTAKDCLACHAPHAPAGLAYGESVAPELCGACHAGPTAELVKQGGAHKELGCAGCHARHGDIPACAGCHAPTERAHFALKDCASCHAPHAPLAKPLAEMKDSETACATCHGGVIEEFKRHGGKHQSEVACQECHLRHPAKGEKAQVDCASCHAPDDKPHYALKECASCHHGHRPLKLDFVKAGAVKEACLSCHEGIVTVTEGISNRHDNLDCTKCHLTHGEDTPQCLGCHPPHDDKMGEKDCQACHDPHNPMAIRYPAEVAPDLCGACHAPVVEELKAKGGAHLDQAGCSACHPRHKPVKESEPLACAECHAPEENPHFALKDCQSCHGPHSPLAKPLAEMANVGAACVTCHAQPKADMDKTGDAHSQQPCIDCHAEHGFLPDCRQCHEPHAESMTRDDCQKCHPAHAPSALAFDAKIGASLCGACHEGPTALLGKAGGKHQAVGCGGCHQEHGAIPSCADCHAPSESAHFAVADCTKCHHAHAPEIKDLSRIRGVRPACVSCHEGPGRETSDFPSVHSEMGCNECHPKHAEAKSCFECHGPHSPEMTYEDCLRCHAPHKPTLTDFSGNPSTALCSACHASQVADLDRQGGAHKTAVSCADCHGRHPGVGCTNCHAQHPEAGVAALISCATCHDPAANAHFNLGGCAQCHPPHSPLAIDLKAVEPVKPACISCHPAIGAELQALPSAHTKMDCNECHQVHGEYISCLGCHQPHAPGMSYEDCLRCHAPHQPTALNYPKEVPEALCGSCHGDEAAKIADKGGAHKTKATCASCHPSHKPHGQETILSCRTCHPRLQKLHYTSEPCTPCHDPHAPMDLNLDSRKEVKPVCVSCHSEVGRFMEFNPSAHSGMDCRECHENHGDFKECLSCHAGHTPEMTYADCLRCHSPHKPTDIAFAREVNPAHCSSCHGEVAKTIEDKGMAHKTAVTCVDCHKAHPPQTDGVMPECAACHDPKDNSHYQVGGCVTCHDPHAPLELDFSQAKETRAACIGCHGDINQAMQARPSKHLEVDCALCHPTHGGKQACVECHAPHSPEMTSADCLVCHPAHTPTQMNFTDGLPSIHCAACHGEVSAMLAASPAKHRELDCVTCHQGTHGSAMSCEDCHGQPHEAGLHSKFPDCLKCHTNPHNLANWKAQ